MQEAQQHAERMRRYAADLGADYLFLYGGTLDQSQTSTPLAAMNLTVIGAFLVPSQKLDADVKAAGSLVDVRSGRVVLSVSADGAELPVLGRGNLLGRFVLAPEPDTTVTLEQRVVALRGVLDELLAGGRHLVRHLGRDVDLARGREQPVRARRNEAGSDGEVEPPARRAFPHAPLPPSPLTPSCRTRWFPSLPRA